MTTMAEHAEVENARAKQVWSYGGSDLHPPKMPARKRPAKEPALRVVRPVVEQEAMMPAFDEALEHVNWCRNRGMSPQCVADSIKAKITITTWSMAVAVVEGEINRMRRRQG